LKLYSLSTVLWVGKTHVVNALRDIEELVEIHDDHFNQATPDTDWLPVVASKGWIILTADKKIAHRRLEMMAVQNSGACMFVLVSGNLSGIQMAEIFAQAVPSMKSFFNRPYLVYLYQQLQCPLFSFLYQNLLRIQPESC